MITTILSKINLIKTSNNVLWNIFHKTLILSVFIHINNFILSQLRQPPTTSIDWGASIRSCARRPSDNSAERNHHRQTSAKGQPNCNRPSLSHMGPTGCEGENCTPDTSCCCPHHGKLAINYILYGYKCGQLYETVLWQLLYYFIIFTFYFHFGWYYITNKLLLLLSVQ